MPRLRAALVADDRVVAHLATRALQETFELRTFQTSSDSFVDAVAEWAPAVLVMRGVLAVGTAVEAMKQLRAAPRLAATPVVVLCNGTEGEDAYLAAGASAIVPLPFSASHLLETVERAASTARTILYAEDSRVVHRLIVPTLVAAGYTVVETFNGREALDVLESGRKVDLVLSDVDMPELDGLQLCSRIKADVRLRDIPVLLLTSREGEDAVQAGFSSGADDYLMKPVVVAEMLSRIDRFLQGRAEEREERVLVVDPDETAARVLQRSLATHSLGCDIAPDAATAHYLLAQRPYALALMECRMQGVDGATLLRQLRDAPATADLPVIMTSAALSLAEQTRVRSLGIQSFVVKPYPPERLLAEVERTLANLRHRRQVAAMRGYLSEGAIEAIERRTATSGAEPRAESTFRSILFLDIVGFTTLCESMAALDVVRFLNTFFDEVVPTLTRHGASIDKFIGDCVMAVFPHEQSGAQRAVLSALDVMDQLPTIRERTGIDVHVRVGINAGSMVMGDIGSTHHRRDFTVIGDHVNVAARLQAAAGVDEVYVSELVARQVPEQGFTLAEVGSLSVKGRREPVRAFRVSRSP